MLISADISSETNPCCEQKEERGSKVLISDYDHQRRHSLAQYCYNTFRVKVDDAVNHRCSLVVWVLAHILTSVSKDVLELVALSLGLQE